MKLLFELRPVEHLDASVDYYRDLGLLPMSWPFADRTGAAVRLLDYRPYEQRAGDLKRPALATAS